MPAPHTPPRPRAHRQNEWLFKGILCALIGLGVLLSPHFITSPGMQGIVAQSSVVGWFALVLGLALVGRHGLARRAERQAAAAAPPTPTAMSSGARKRRR